MAAIDAEANTDDGHGDGHDDWPARLEVTDPVAVELLTGMRSLRMLTPFFVRTHTLSSAASALGRPPSSLAYWIPRFVGAGLLEVRGHIRRAGAAMPLYRTAARTLVAPVTRIPFDARVRLLDEGRMRVLRRFLDGLDESFRATRSFGLSFSANAVGQTAINIEEFTDDHTNLHFTDGWSTLELTDDDARQLTSELEELITRYTGRTGPKKFLCHVGLAPEPTIRWRSANDH